MSSDKVCTFCLEENENRELPIKLLNCSHTFCYMCIKSYLLSTGKFKCPLCRATIPKDILEHVTKFELENEKIMEDKSNKIWRYSGKNNGWWKYNISCNKKLNEHYDEYVDDNTKNSFEISIGYNKYLIDFDKMQQISLDGTKIRNIKFTEPDDTSMDELTKGMAGIQLNVIT
jgi:hypothetical protein